MLEVSQIKASKDELIDRLQVRNFDAREPVNKIIELDEKRKLTQGQLDTLLSKINASSKEIGELFKLGKTGEANGIKEGISSLKVQSKELGETLSLIEGEIKTILLEIPNRPHKLVPAGKSSEDNEIIEEHGEVPVLGDDAKPHWELADQYDIIDFELGSKITGSDSQYIKVREHVCKGHCLTFFWIAPQMRAIRKFNLPCSSMKIQATEQANYQIKKGKCIT